MWTFGVQQHLTHLREWRSTPSLQHGQGCLSHRLLAVVVAGHLDKRLLPKRGKMERREITLEADRLHQNRLSSVTEDEEDQDAAYTIVTVLDKVANIVDSVQASQKRIEERHREMENAIKTIQIDILKLAQAHGNTGYTVNKLLEKTHKVSSTMKEVRARVERQSANVRKVQTKQEEMLRKNKFRVVIYQVTITCLS